VSRNLTELSVYCAKGTTSRAACSRLACVQFSRDTGSGYSYGLKLFQHSWPCPQEPAWAPMKSSRPSARAAWARCPEVTVDKRSIKAAIDSGADVPGAGLVTGRHSLRRS
jgi:hypothetical protein